MIVAQKIFDRFEVVNIKGAGGQGEVAEGLDLTTGKKVLIKALKEDFHSNDVALERFRREGSVRSDSPYIASPIAADSSFIVFPYIDALDLAELMHSGEWIPDPTALLSIMIKVCNGLKDLNSLGIVHRDVKPANILYDASNDVVVLIDLGIAHFKTDPRITQNNIKLATPLYASPEQLTSPLNIDHRSDIFSLGVTAYEIATGIPAFEASTTEEITQRILYENPEPVQKINPNIPEFISVAIEIMMAKDPLDRFQTAEETIYYLSGSNIYHCLACGQKSGVNSCSGCNRSYIREKLLVVTPDNRRRIYSIPVGDYDVGRREFAGYPHVSSKHCLFSVNVNGEIKIKDNNSTNKTCVNRKLAGEQIKVTADDIIEIADLTAFVVNA